MTARELMLQLGLVDPETPVCMLSPKGYLSRVRGIDRMHDPVDKTIQITLLSHPAPELLPKIDDKGYVTTDG